MTRVNYDQTVIFQSRGLEWRARLLGGHLQVLCYRESDYGSWKRAHNLSVEQVWIPFVNGDEFKRLQRESKQ